MWKSSLNRPTIFQGAYLEFSASPKWLGIKRWIRRRERDPRYVREFSCEQQRRRAWETSGGILNWALCHAGREHDQCPVDNSLWESSELFGPPECLCKFNKIFLIQRRMISLRIIYRAMSRSSTKPATDPRRLLPSSKMRPPLRVATEAMPLSFLYPDSNRCPDRAKLDHASRVVIAEFPCCEDYWNKRLLASSSKDPSRSVCWSWVHRYSTLSLHPCKSSPRRASCVQHLQ